MILSSNYIDYKYIDNVDYKHIDDEHNDRQFMSAILSSLIACIKCDISF
jgi:hypothetical protein